LEGKEASFLKHIRECAEQRQLSHLSVERTQHQVRAQLNEWQEKDSLVPYGGKLYVLMIVSYD